MGTESNTSIRKQYLVAACLYLGQLLIGFTMGWTTPLLPILTDPDQTPLDRAITDGEASWVVSITFFGIIGGPYISGYLSNVVGRKPCLYLGGSVFVLSYILLAVAKSLPLLYVARTFVGVGLGVLFVTHLVYIGEFSSPRVRGTLLTLTGFFATTGILLVYSVGPFISYAAINWIGVVLCAAYLVGVFFFVPETAVYQVMKGRSEEAVANLTSLGRQDDIDEIVAQANEKPKPKIAQLTEMYTVKTNRRAAFIIISLNVFSQFSGMMAVIAFVTVIFEMTGSTMEAHVSTIIIGVTQVFAAVIAPVLVDRTGRKILLLASTAGCSLSLVVDYAGFLTMFSFTILSSASPLLEMVKKNNNLHKVKRQFGIDLRLAALGTYFYLYNNGYPIAENLQWLSLVSVMIYCIAYYSGMGVIPNTFIAEMFTDTCRSFGGTFAVSVSFMFGFGVSTAFGYLLTAWGPSVIFWIFSGACALAFIFTIVVVPETKGKSLLEIQALLST